MIQRWGNKNYKIKAIRQDGGGRSSKSFDKKTYKRSWVNLAKTSQFIHMTDAGSDKVKNLEAGKAWTGHYVPAYYCVIPDRLKNTIWGGRRLYIVIYDVSGKSRDVFIARSRRTAKLGALGLKGTLRVDIWYKPVKSVGYINLNVVRY